MANMEYWIYLNGVPFTVDTVNNELQYGDRLHEPVSLNHLKDEGQFYSLLLNRSDNSLFTGMLHAAEENADVIRLVIPKVVFEERFWDNDAQINSINKMSYERDWNILAVNQPLFDRLNGNYPLIDIAGSEFVIDLRHRELQKYKSWDVRIDLDELYKNKLGQYEGFYDLKTQQICSSSKAIEAGAQNVVGIIIPEDTKLDPFVSAPGQGAAAMKFIAGHPVSALLVATILPASEMKSAQEMMKNQQNAKQPPVLKHDQTGKARRKGKRL